MLYMSMYPQRYVDVHNMSVSQSCLCPFLCNPYIALQNFLIFLFTCKCINLNKAPGGQVGLFRINKGKAIDHIVAFA